MPIIDIHTHCSPRPAGDPFGVAQALRGTPIGKNTVTNYRGLPAVSYHEMFDLDLQQETCARAGITGRIISTPFAAEVMTAVSKSPARDIVKAEAHARTLVHGRSVSGEGSGQRAALGFRGPERSNPTAQRLRCPLMGDNARPLPRRVCE